LRIPGQHSLFGFGDDPKLVKDSTLAVTLFAGLLGSVLCASNSLAREIRTGTALAVLSKPVGRMSFLLAKYAGLAAAVNGADPGQPDRLPAGEPHGLRCLRKHGLAGPGWFTFALVAAYGMGGFSNFFLRRPLFPMPC
jgi:hypothetical protein